MKVWFVGGGRGEGDGLVLPEPRKPVMMVMGIIVP